MKKRINFIISFTLLALCAFVDAYAVNPTVSSYWKNMSGMLNTADQSDLKPQILTHGNTVHIAWVEYDTQNDTCRLYYQRSADHGKNWTPPLLLSKIVGKAESLRDWRTQYMALSGDTVYIAYPEYRYYSNGTGYIMFTRSVDNGVNFEAVRPLANTGGGYYKISSSGLRCVGAKVGIAYHSERNGIHFMYSDNGGTSFTDTIAAPKVTYNSSYIDFAFDGQKAVIMHQYSYYYYGFNVGKVYVTTTHDDGKTFVTTKLSKSYELDGTNYEKSNVFPQDNNFYNYYPVLSLSGNNVYVVFEEWKNPNWHTMFAKSADGGITFGETMEFADTNFGSSQNYPCLVAKSNYIYVAHKQVSDFNLKVSADSGETFSDTKSFFKTGFHPAVQKPWLFKLLIDPNDTTGKTVYYLGNTHFLATSVDGGATFSKILNHSCYSRSEINSDLAIASNGAKHWAITMKPLGGTDYDIYYHSTDNEPAPSNTDSYYNCSEKPGNNRVSLAINSSYKLNFDSAMTAELWVKFRPDSTSKAPLFRKLKGGTYYDDTPYGYQMTYRVNSGKVSIQSGVQTDKGRFVNWCPSDISDTLWHHVAYTYDARGQLNNFKTYVDGVVLAQQTVTGFIDSGEGILSIGPDYYSNSYNALNYKMDNLRFWSRALSQSEIQENMLKTTFVGDTSLVMYLPFDGTFKDLSGNGNDGVPMLGGELISSNFNPPHSRFDTYTVLNKVNFVNQSQAATVYNWKFGDADTSTQQHPTHTYVAAGEYSVDLFASNATTVTSKSTKVVVKGLDKIEPTRAGNKGYLTLNVFGGGLDTINTVIKIAKAGKTDVSSVKVFKVADGVLQTQLHVDSIEIGKWDVIVSKGNVSDTLKSALSIDESKQAMPWVSVAGRGAILYNTWQTFTINYGNNGNVDTHGVPIWLAITDDPNLEVEFIDFTMNVPQLAKDKGIENEIKAIGEYFTVDTIDGEPFHGRVYPFLIPVIKANTSNSLRIRIKTPKTITMKTWIHPSWIEPVTYIEPTYTLATYKAPQYAQKACSCSTGTADGDGFAAAECAIKVLGLGVIDIGTSAIPGVGCVWSIGKYAYDLNQPSSFEDKKSILNTLWSGGTTFVDCAVNLSGIGGIMKGFGVFLSNMGQYASQMKDCSNMLKKDGNDKNIRAVGSFDPNEMIGPSGYGDQNWIPMISDAPYTILFENKKTASAPAHMVVVLDSLDVTKFDVHDCSLGKVGWGDTIISPPGDNLKEFSIDVDLRPNKELIARVSAKIDTVSAVARWEFRSLNPTTMEDEEDPLMGFLPPNETSPQGEGFVSFSVGVNQNLTTAQQLSNKGTIYFDANVPIVTNEYKNAIDVDVPQSQVTTFSTNSTDTTIVVNWSGSDSGSGIKKYYVVAQKDNEAPQLWLSGTTLTQAQYPAKAQSTYKFYSIAEDYVNLQEKAPQNFDLEVFFSSINNLRTNTDNWIIYPNPAMDELFVKTLNAHYNEQFVVQLINSNGTICKRLTFKINSNEQTGTAGAYPISLIDLPAGLYLVQIFEGNKKFNRLIVKQ